MDGNERGERLERLFRPTYRRVTAYCLRRTGEAAAHDAVAEVYAVAWRRRRQLPADDEEAVLWLLGIARRVLANQERGRRRWARLLLRVAERSEPRPPYGGDSSGAGDDLAVALARLPVSDRELLRLAYWDDLSRAGIASVLGISVGAVDTRMHRARQRLKQHLTTAHPDQAPTKEKEKEKNHAER
ncbi:RNA polymerase sigma-70 factor (ECF subfamily) [Streptomyces aurantiacus]|uniref:RNA polymerase sigma factor n=1 Tax=Streptomyces aurantiacus TaxID=47760 RepID=UPI002790C51E|nr:RNA polymerase sigma factor [Streptomyces aurantiacus]MDQ0779524.1 RNA polymerase sigma-70 factor (ECF subfamily) [Streptomyces aurantiacus]